MAHYGMKNRGKFNYKGSFGVVPGVYGSLIVMAGVIRVDHES